MKYKYTTNLYKFSYPRIINKNRYKLLASALHISSFGNENMNNEEDNSEYEPKHKIIRLLDNMNA